MKVHGKGIPKPILVENFHPKQGYVEVRLRENVTEVTETIPDTDTTYTLYEYDEYTFLLPKRDGLEEEIEKNLEAWLTTGRQLEVNERASSVQDMLSTFKRLGDLTPITQANTTNITDIQLAMAEMYELMLGGINNG